MKEFTKIYKYSQLSNDRIEKLRELTANSYSGMNYVLSSLKNIKERNKVKAYIIIHYINSVAVGWALATKEPNGFFHYKSYKWNPKDGFWIQVYVHPDYRNKGIAKKLIERYNKYFNEPTYYACHMITNVFQHLNKPMSIML
jgi:GNAT superfamily N-acetyltransferase